MEKELKVIFQEHGQISQAFSLCEKVLNRYGSPSREIRLIRIDNRGTSRCAWEGCNNVTPRRENALRNAIAQQIYTVFQSELRNNGSRLSVVDIAIDDLSMLGKRLRGASGDDIQKEKKVLRKKSRIILKDLKGLLYKPDVGDLDRDKAWKYIETGVLNIMEKSGGRNRYCREHSSMYIKTILAGKPVPFKRTISESDITSRREQIAYQKIWRYIEARILPLVPEGIDRIVVERNAFDLLAGSRKNIQGASDKFIEDMYQQGPMYGFRNVSEMLKEEFGGLCAYCGRESQKLLDRDHVLPRADFFFDGYLNILPACPQCNSALKGKRSLSAMSLTISPKAYEAYTQYLKKKFRNRPLHYFHTVKKGILSLMQDPQRLWEAEQCLRLIANQYARIVQTQRSPRPFARYLNLKLSRKQGQVPEIRFRSGRHTALYRNVAYPDFSKWTEKKEGNVINHALDAVLLASDLPDPYPLESLNLSLYHIRGWKDAVRTKAPKACKEGIPMVPRYDFFVKGFEDVDSLGYVTVDTTCMNWNQKDSMTHKQDPYGGSESQPTKRTAAADLYTTLKQETSETKIRSLVERIHHHSLKKMITERIDTEKPGTTAAEGLKKWIRQSVKNSVKNSRFSNHPGDQARKAELENFAYNEGSSIPSVIGVKMFDTGVRNVVNLARIDKQTSGIGHRYMTFPANKGVILAYPKDDSGNPDLTKPRVAHVKQSYAVRTEGTSEFKPVPPELSDGIVIGKRNKGIGEWKKDLEVYLSSCDFHSYVFLTAGCVLCYSDGKNQFLRNFKKGKDFKKEILKDVVGIRRTPFVRQVTPLKYLS
ncbi:MAG: HNH endonuclease [Syntrophales bacterium]|nr:HNH endonuclease [Syntrophales bacterium]